MGGRRQALPPRALLRSRPFLADFEPFAARVAEAGDRAALGQLVLKLTAPGVPDIYQGDELPFRALVDPDNRRPVDWDWQPGDAAAPDGRLAARSRETRKLFVTLRLLGLRARRPEPFAGGYEPLDAGAGACAFVRGGEVLVVVGVRGGRRILRGDARGRRAGAGATCCAARSARSTAGDRSPRSWASTASRCSSA